MNEFNREPAHRPRRAELASARQHRKNQPAIEESQVEGSGPVVLGRGPLVLRLPVCDDDGELYFLGDDGELPLRARTLLC